MFCTPVYNKSKLSSEFHFFVKQEIMLRLMFDVRDLVLNFVDCILSERIVFGPRHVADKWGGSYALL